MTRDEQKRKGRPPKTEDERKSINLTFRAREFTRAPSKGGSTKRKISK